MLSQQQWFALNFFIFPVCVSNNAIVNKVIMNYCNKLKLFFSKCFEISKSF